MYRDRPPSYVTGFGTTSSSIPWDETEEEGASSEAGILSRRLHGHPIRRFFVTGALTLTGMAVAGSLIKKGGVQLAARWGRDLIEEGGVKPAFRTELIQSARKIQGLFDDWEGTTRVLPKIPGTDIDDIFDFGGAKPTNLNSYFFARDKRARKAAGSALDSAEEWTYKDEIRRSLIRQVRRLPYELPAAYATQRMLLDPIIGTTPKERRQRPNWANPIDVLGDFAQQSFKNLTQLLVPLDAGGAVLGEGWRRFMNMADYAGVDPRMLKGRQASIQVSRSLELVGQDAAKLLYNTANYSTRSSGAFAAAIQDSMANTKGFVQHLAEVRSARSRAAAAGVKPSFTDYFRYNAADVKVGPFGGLQSFARTFKETWDRNEQTVANSVIERAAQNMGALRGRGRLEAGPFFTKKLSSAYRQMLTQNLVRSGMGEEEATAAVQQLGVRPPRGGEQFALHRRISFGDRPNLYSGSEWRDELERRVHVLDPTGVLGQELGGAARRTDAEFLAAKPELGRQFRAEWEHFESKQMPEFLRQRLKPAKLPENMFTAGDPAGEEYLLRQLATHLRIKDANHISNPELRQKLTQLGFNMGDRGQIQAYFESEGLAHPPWHRRGFNMLGLKPLTVERADEIGYFDRLPPGLQRDVRNLIRQVKQEESAMGRLGGLEMGGVYETNFKLRGGRGGPGILDLNPMRRSLRKVGDLTADYLQMPLLHFSPLDLMLHHIRRTFAESPMIQMEAGTGGLPFLPKGAIAPNESVFLMKDTEGKGRLYRVGSRMVEGRLKPFSEPISDRAYRSISTDNIHSRLAAGRGKGFISDEPVTGWRKAFDIDPNQPQSAAAFFQRWRNRDTDLRNPRTYVRRMLAGDLEGVPEEEEARAILGLQNDLRGHVLSGRMIRLFEQAAAAGELPPELSGVLERTGRISHIRDPQKLLQVVEQMVREDDPRRLFDDPKDISKFYAAQGRVRSYLNRAHEERFLEGPSNKRLQRMGIHSRMDELKAAIYDYQVARQGLLANAQDGSQRIITEMLETIEDFRAKRLFSAKETTEARAAVLGMQVNLVRNLERGTSASAARNIIAPIHDLTDIRKGPGSRKLLEEYAEFGGRPAADANPFARGLGNLKWKASRTFNAADYEPPGVRYNPIAARQHRTFIPTFGTVFAEHPVRAMANVLGATTWSDPETFSFSSIWGSHFFQRLNRYFSTFGGGLNEAAGYKGPMDFYARGMIGKRILPMVAGGALAYAADATLGGWTHKRDDQGKRVYQPAVMGLGADILAHGEMIGAGILPGGMTYRQKREQLLHGDVPVRRGRWWPLGNTPWRGDRIMYYRPSWYRRYMSGYKYTDQMYKTPLQHLLYDTDFSPLRPLDPYRFEKQHYADRPYPVTGEYFTGPWGPLTGALNATVGKVLKPRRMMHQEEMRQALSQYQAIGQYAAQAPAGLDEAGRVLVRTARRQTVQIPMSAKAVLGLAPIGLGGGPGMTAAGASYLAPTDPSRGTRRDQGTAVAVIGGGGGRGGGGGGGGAGGGHIMAPPGGVALAVGGRSGGIARGTILQLNQMYADASSRPTLGRRPAYDYPVTMTPAGLRPRRITRAKPVDPQSLKYQASMTGYQLQELFGIYGFGFGAVRSGLGIGIQDLSPRQPVLQAASRAYGSERSFWDYGLGGLGDFPTPFAGEFGNIEISEIARRFVPHRRRDENELNPIPNQLGQQYPWLPGNDYFLNLKQGDPYAAVPEGEMRLPGAAYERFNDLHPDSTGKYGLVDKFKILGDVAPWSDQYDALAKVLQVTHLTPEEQDVVRGVKDQVRAKKKIRRYQPYLYDNQKFETQPVTITGYVPGRADQFYTEQFGPEHPIRLSGVRASRKNRSEGARQYMERYVEPGETYQATFDANRGPLWGANDLVDVYLQNKEGLDINQRLMNSGYGKKAQMYTPLDRSQEENPIAYRLKGIAEKLAHRNTLFNSKFLPNRTAVEDWERRNVYGATFPQWQCFDTETKVLTDSGWKAYDEFDGNELLWTLNTEAGVGEWAKLDALNVYDYSGEMYEFVGRTINALVTPNHRWPTINQYDFQNDRTDTFRFKETKDLNTSDYLPRGGYVSREVDKTVDDGFVSLIAWIVTEGSYPESHPNEVEIYQSPCANSENCTLIEQTLRSLGCHYRLVVDSGSESRRPCNSYILSGAFGKGIREAFPDKIVTRDFIDRLTVEQKLLFINVVILGDGNVKDNRYFTSRHQEAELMSILFAQAGLSFSKKWVEGYTTRPNGEVGYYQGYRFTFHKRKYWRYARHKPVLVEYDGIVWCPTTKNNTVFMMRGEVTCWSGNSPIKDFLLPMLYRAANRDVISGSLILGGVGAMFGRTKTAARVGAMIGGTLGLGMSLFSNTGTEQTGERFIPEQRKKEMATEEYTGILNYVKYSNLYNQARQASIKQEGVDPEVLTRNLPEGSRRFTPVGPITQQALQYRKQVQRTEYGADPWGDMMDIYQAIPKRKRPYFMEFVNAPISERARILSTAPRLERRIYEQRWGLRTEQRPDLREYFKERELPPPDWEGWNPNVDMETVKLKIANSQGLDVSQMGYYPQQVREANLLNPSYPDINQGSDPRRVQAQLQQMLGRSNINGTVRAIPSMNGNSVQFNAGVG